MNNVCKRISKIAFYSTTFFGIFLSMKGFSDVTNFTIISGDVNSSLDLQISTTTLEMQTANHTLLKYPNLTIEKSETISFVQPNKEATTFIVVENGPLTIEGRLQGNGRVYLIAPDGFTLAQDASISIDGELVIFNQNPRHEEFWKENPMQFTNDSKGGVLLSDNASIDVTGNLTIIGKSVEKQLNNTSFPLNDVFFKRDASHQEPIKIFFPEGIIKTSDK